MWRTRYCNTYYHVFMIMKLITTYSLLTETIEYSLRLDFISIRISKSQLTSRWNGICVALNLHKDTGHLYRSSTKIICTFKNKLMNKKKSQQLEWKKKELYLHSLITTVFLVMSGRLFITQHSQYACFYESNTTELFNPKITNVIKWQKTTE